MASRTITQLVSDLSGEDIAEGRGETIQFSYRGANYTIDLTDKEAAAFDRSIATYVEHATPTGRVRRTARATARSNGDAKAIREWAKDAGLDVPDRGRIPSQVRARYDEAH